MVAKLRPVKVFESSPPVPLSIILTPCPPLHKCGEGERRTPLSSPLSAWRRGGQGVRTEGRGDQRGEDRRSRSVVILSERAGRARAKDLQLLAHLVELLWRRCNTGTRDSGFGSRGTWNVERFRTPTRGPPGARSRAPRA